MFPGRICGIQVRPNRIKCVFCFLGIREGRIETRRKTKKKKKTRPRPDPLSTRPSHSSAPTQLRSPSLFHSSLNHKKNKKKQQPRLRHRLRQRGLHGPRRPPREEGADDGLPQAPGDGRLVPQTMVQPPAVEGVEARQAGRGVHPQVLMWRVSERWRGRAKERERERERESERASERERL